MTILLLFVLCIVILITLSLRRHNTHKARSPPGPPGIPLLGNVFDIPTKSQWLVFSDWRKKYGDVIGVSVPGTRIIILNSRKALESILVERSALHSGRPPFTLMRKCLGIDWSVALLPQGEEVFRQRKMMTQCLGPSPMKKYLPEAHRNAYEMCLKIAESPQERTNWTKLMVVKNIAQIVYGFNIKDLDDDYVVLSERYQKVTQDVASLGAHPIDVIPVLRFLPLRIWGRKFVKQYFVTREYTSNAFNIPYEISQKFIGNGTAHPQSMVEQLVARNTQKDGYTISDEFSIKGITATAFSAGVDTTRGAIDIFVLLMICNPSVQAKAQKIMDEALRGERLPNISDRERADLVYIEALVMEIHRWSSLVPLAVPHAVDKDDVYDGMLLKAGSTIIPNTWGCLHDEEDYPDPMTFKPERFLESDPDTGGNGMRLRKDVPDPRSIAFGYGRRACPGRHLADVLVWIAITSLLCVFDFSKSPHPTLPGEFVEPDLEFESTLAVISPKPYECETKVRSDAALELVRVVLEK